MNSNEKEKMVVFCSLCTFWGDISAAAKSDSGIPVCPECGFPLYEMPKYEWDTNVSRYDAGHPGYAEMMRWSKNRCFNDFRHLSAQYAMYKRVMECCGGCCALDLVCVGKDEGSRPSCYDPGPDEPESEDTKEERPEQT